jgi:hypothetical protein
MISILTRMCNTYVCSGNDINDNALVRKYV